ncbi:cyclase dehydrase [Siccirubricoccus sp. G192]|uniref:cyclase dehydrase n=1 Tax=Siccirubricoccus sp. G192 TaxID=2849651 RepID=UPI001C2CB480|nr:cyclase dehydrase [Siccirubricoccus sp. G192]MBV1799799.1 cyclase dehydrase [Siccirubricoccus sp. G192]
MAHRRPDRQHAASRRRRRDSADRLARGLGWFSIALGATELLASRGLTRALGMEGNERLVASYGLREIATGAGILASENPAPWIWGRVGGDVLDLGTLATALDGRNPRQENAGLAFAAVLGVTVLDVICARALGGRRRQGRVGFRDYADRSGLPRPSEAMRGAARDFQVPRDMRVPEPLRPYKVA